VLEENIELLQIWYPMNNLLFVHAGITKTFLSNNNIQENEYLAKNVNSLFKRSRNNFKFTSGKTKIGMEMIFAKPLYGYGLRVY
jgi:hypothetical protein